MQREVQQCKQEIEERKTKESLDATFFIDKIKDQSAKQIVDLMTENTRVKVCSESSTADEDSVRVQPHKVLEQNNQLQNELQEQIVKHQKLKKRNAQLHVKLLEEKERFTVRKQVVLCWNTV